MPIAKAEGLFLGFTEGIITEFGMILVGRDLALDGGEAAPSTF